MNRFKNGLMEYRLEISVIVFVVVMVIVLIATCKDIAVLGISIMVGMSFSVIYYKLLKWIMSFYSSMKTNKINPPALRECVLLYLNGNTIHMRELKVKDKNLFLDEFKKIVEYAQEVGLERLIMNTHFVLTMRLINIFKTQKGTDSQFRRIINDMSISSTKTFKSNIGEIEVQRLEDGINVCARYEYIKLTLSNIKKSLCKNRLYRITIKLK